MSTFMKKLAESLKQIRTKSESYHTMGIDAGVSAKTIATIVKYPEKSFSKNTITKVTEYVQKALNTPEPLSIKDINFLQSQNAKLKEQNKSLQEENRKLKEQINTLKRTCGEWQYTAAKLRGWSR